MDVVWKMHHKCEKLIDRVKLAQLRLTSLQTEEGNLNLYLINICTDAEEADVQGFSNSTAVSTPSSLTIIHSTVKIVGDNDRGYCLTSNIYEFFARCTVTAPPNHVNSTASHSSVRTTVSQLSTNCTRDSMKSV